MRAVVTLGVTTLLLFIVLFATYAAAKGVTGIGRASGGGYYRSSKVGYYSRTNRYYVTSMYWRSGYSYAYKGPSFRTSAGALSGEQLTDLICKRDVRVDTNAPVPNFGSSIVFNSTQRCYNENTNVPGAPENQYIDTLMLNRYRVGLKLAPYPTVDMVVYPDKDIVIGLVNNTFRLVSLALSAFPAGAPVATIDLGSLVWQPCTLDSCSTTAATSAFGYPSSRFVEGGRVYTVSAQSTVTTPGGYSLSIQLRFWLSNDFDEDAIYDHVFLMPGATKIDISLTPLNVATAACYPSIVGLVAAPAPPATASQVQFMPISADKLATEYGPQRMQRFQIGSSTDLLNGVASYLSWPASTDKNVLCFSATGTTCMSMATQSAPAITAAITCRSTDATLPATCQNGLLRDGQVAYQFTWSGMGPISASQTGWTWSLNLGYHDQSVGTQTDSSMAHGIAFVVALVVVMTTLSM